jgi:hypothetical protein
MLQFSNQVKDAPVVFHKAFWAGVAMQNAQSTCCVVIPLGLHAMDGTDLS